MTPMIPADRICVACEEADGKYKCPRCLRYTCSLACNKKHREEHAGDETSAHVSSEASSLLADQTASTLETIMPSQPGTEVGDDGESDELNVLFRKYPLLRSQLKSIADATDPPPPEDKNHNHMNPRRKKQQPWTREVGYQNGIDALRRALQKDVSGGLQEYCELVKILNERKDRDNAEEARRQAAARDAEVIGQLMREERD
ncbi:hypothetical protein BX600DRAFT_507093 [Xylariales sp. PMI_506]|nr:hypothetical protein BX600DRAFT_507093 [Xylariales sp. PMI_506]